MRADMKKVLCERPRARGLYTYNDVRHRQNHGDHDLLPHCQGMRQPYAFDPKEFNDLLGPLHRFMRSFVGRPWDEMWSELSAHVRSDSTTGEHLRGHARSDCDIHTVVIDGKVLSRGRYGAGSMEPRGLYVDPRDGLIYYNEYRSYHNLDKPIIVDGLAYTQREDGVLLPRRGWGRKLTGKYPLKVIGDQRAMWINGIWYWIIREEVPPPTSVPYLVEGKTLHRVVYHPRYDFVIGDDVKEGWYHATKRQIASRDLRRYGLINS